VHQPPPRLRTCVSVATRHAGLLTAFSGRTSGQSNGERGSQAALVEQIQPGVVMHTPDVFMVGHKPQILKQHRPRDDVCKSTLAGFPIVAAGEDDYNEWGSILYPEDPYAVLGFTSIYEPSSSPLYHVIFLAPPIWSTLDQIDSGGIDSVPRADAARAILTLIHEAYHQRLYSGDESRVNACALGDFGSTIQSQFGVSPTVEQIVTTPIVTRQRVRHAVWRTVKGKRVRRYVYHSVPPTATTPLCRTTHLH
jgi:hypothetical protein